MVNASHLRGEFTVMKAKRTTAADSTVTITADSVVMPFHKLMLKMTAGYDHEKS